MCNTASPSPWRTSSEARTGLAPVSGVRLLARSLLVLLPLLAACDHNPFRPRTGSATVSSAPSTTASAVNVAHPIRREVTDVVDLTGRTASTNAVDIRARVTGYLLRAAFTEGAVVNAGDLLFEIDPRPYQAALDRATAEVALNQARLELANADNARGKAIAAANPGAISQQELDRRQASVNEAAAALDAAKAEVESAQLNLAFTRVTSPIDGRTGRIEITPGNLVTQDTSLLTTVVVEDPIDVYFDVDEPTMLRVIRRLRETGVNPRERGAIPVFMGLSDEVGYPHAGEADFADNVVNSSTGTLTARGRFPNPSSKSGIRLLRPGMFVRVRLPIGPPYEALLVNQEAIANDQGRRYVLVVDDSNVLRRRPVELGAVQDDGLRVVTRGVERGDAIVVEGVQFLRDGETVRPSVVPMPIPGQDDTASNVSPDNSTGGSPGSRP